MEEINDGSDNLRYALFAVTIVVDFLAVYWLGEVAVLIIILGFILLWFKPWSYKIEQVTVIQQQLQFNKTNAILGRKSYLLPVNKVDFNYRKRNVRLHRNSFGSTEVDTGYVLMVFYKEHLLFDLTPNEDGWKDASIKRVAFELKRNGINQLLEKYGTDDVVL